MRARQTQLLHLKKQSPLAVSRLVQAGAVAAVTSSVWSVSGALTIKWTIGAGAGSVDRRCRLRLNHAAGVYRSQDPGAGHFRSRPILLKNSGGENLPRICARQCSRQRISGSPDDYQARRNKLSRASGGWSSKRTKFFNRIDPKRTMHLRQAWSQFWRAGRRDGLAIGATREATPVRRELLDT